MLALWPQDVPSRNQTPHITKACHSYTSVLMALVGTLEQGRSSQLPQLNHLVCKMKIIMFYPLIGKGLKLGKFYELEVFHPQHTVHSQCPDPLSVPPTYFSSLISSPLSFVAWLMS